MSGHPTWKLVGVGSTASLSAGDSSGTQTMVSLVVAGGFCFNSHKHNTQAPVKVCDQHPVPCPSALDYTVGWFQKWMDFIGGTDLATPCGQLLHGTYDFGAHPSTAIMST